MAESEVLRINKQAMEKLRESLPTEALTLLNSAQEILSQVSIESQAWGVTFYNLGCYFKKTQDLDMARKYFSKALEIFSKKPSDLLTISGTYLNLTSVYSDLNSHDKALSFALKALNLLNKSYEKSLNLSTSLIISYHSAGQEYEFLNKKHEALSMYRQGWELAKEKLGKTHKLTLSIKKTLEKCQVLKSSWILSERTKKSQSFHFRAHSSNPNSRGKLPDIPSRIATPTKDIFNGMQKMEKIPYKTLSVPIKQMSVLNNLVKEIEKSLDFKPKKYVFTKSLDMENEYADKNEEIKVGRGYLESLPLIRKNTTGHTQNNSPISYLQIIPEAYNEDFIDSVMVNRPVMKRPSKRAK
ncbi:hypothetical protein SteCoe_2995 [Stentor coeruleus]|uniref:Uncharacterized protein n=1 Tax=Stentor coeruleus TaxID=5963 RepID=A0A1R2CY48_9CILI|nr:hypothetical protein SteCoe_2995 [Stentor coeruleus]